MLAYSNAKANSGTRVEGDGSVWKHRRDAIALFLHVAGGVNRNESASGREKNPATRRLAPQVGMVSR